MPKSYSSAPQSGGPDEQIFSTEGMGFTLDDTEFACHGQIDAQDLIDLSPLMDADPKAGWLDPQALAAAGHFYRAFMGDETYRQFSAHRRQHRTPPSVVAQIMMDLLQESMARPPESPSPSPGGPPTTGDSSPAGLPPGGSPEPRSVHMPPKQAVDPEGIIPPELADLGDVILSEPATPAEPVVLPRRVINLGDANRTRVETSA